MIGAVVLIVLALILSLPIGIKATATSSGTPTSSTMIPVGVPGYTGPGFAGIDVYNADGTVNEEKIAELELAFQAEFNLVPASKSGNNVGGKYNASSCTAVKGKNLGFSYWDSEGKPRAANGGYMYQCPWWVKGRAIEYLGRECPVSGNGKDFYANNISGGWFNYGSVPKANSLVSYGATSTNEYGHVAYVEAVDTVNGYYYISHAGGGKSWYGVQKVAIGSSPPYVGTILGFIYLDEPISF